MEEVAEEAGLSTGAVYSNFSGKEELFLTLFEERMDRRGREIQELIEGGERPDLQLGAAGREFMELLKTERSWFLLFFEFFTHAARDSGFRGRFLERHEAAQARLAELIEESASELRLRLAIPAQHLAMVITALGYGLALERLLGEERVPDELLGQVMTLLLRGLQAEQEQGR